MQLTGNYKLKKPDQNDAYNIQNENDNMDIIDKTMKEISDAQSNIYITTNSGNNYSVTIPDLTTLRDGYPLTVKFNASSTGSITINPSGLGAIPVVDYFNKQVTNVRQYLIANLRYEANSKNFILLGKGGGGDATADQVLSGKKVTVDSGLLVGIMPNNGFINKQLGINETFDLPKGYLDGGKITQNISTKEGTTIIPGTTDIIIPAGTYLKGDLIIKGDSHLLPQYIMSGITIFNITGTYYASSGGSSGGSGSASTGSISFPRYSPYRYSLPSAPTSYLHVYDSGHIIFTYDVKTGSSTNSTSLRIWYSSYDHSINVSGGTTNTDYEGLNWTYEYV